VIDSATLEPWGGLTPLDGHLWLLRLTSSELAALETDWVAVAGPHPGHDFRRAVIRARETIARARAELEASRRPSSGWAERARGHMRAARRVLVHRQLALHGHWWPPERRYFA
jgi:hypothetical protein